MSAVSVVEHDSHTEVTLDDGKVNALSQALLDALNAAIAAAGSRPLLITGRRGCFSGGFDLKVMRSGGAERRALRAAGHQLTMGLLGHPAPVVLACPGHAMAKAAFTLLCGDWRIGSRGAFRICLNETAIGMPMPLPAMALARDRLAPTWLTRAVLNAESFLPEQALQAGFFDQLCEPAELLEAAREQVRLLGALDPAAYAETKRRLRQPLIERLDAFPPED